MLISRVRAKLINVKSFFVFIHYNTYYLYICAINFRFMNSIRNYHVSYQVRDAWLCIPPCNYSDNPYCHVDCPYFYECYPQDEDCDDV